MKKLIIASLLTGTISFASAQYLGNNSAGNQTQNGAYNGPSSSQNITSARDALLLNDDAYVKMRGKITQHTQGDNYIFADDTGEVFIEIDQDKWRGLTVGPDDLVEIVGEVDKDPNSFKIDVDYITKVQ